MDKIDFRATYYFQVTKMVLLFYKNLDMKKIFLWIVVLLLNQYVIAQVDSLTNGLKGQIIRAFEKSPNSSNVFYAGLKGSALGTGKVYKSTDGGATWYSLNAGQPLDPYVADIQAIAESNTPQRTLWAGTWKNGLFKSIDEGLTWQKDIHFPSSDIRSIRVGVQNPELIYASTSAFGVVKSMDGGKHWERSPAPLIDSTFNFAWNIELDPHNDNIIYAQTFSDGVWKSIDQGKHWNQVLDTKGKVCWDMKISNRTKDIWVATSQRGDTLSTVFHSLDAGDTWEEISGVPQIGVNQVNVVESDVNNILFVGSWQDGVYKFKNGTWSKVDEVDFDGIAHMLSMDEKLLIGSWGNGVYIVDAKE